MAERQDLEAQRRARSDDEPKRVEERNEERRHPPSLPERACNLNGHSMYGGSGSHKQPYAPNA
jgi:hypothetical protein